MRRMKHGFSLQTFYHHVSRFLGRERKDRACLHLVTLCVSSDRISIWFVTFGHNINWSLHFIHHQPITRLKIATGERAASAGEKICYFMFSLIRNRLRVGLLAISVAMCLAYLTTTCHIAYYTLSHICFFYILGGVKCAYVVSTSRCIYTCPV